VGCIELTKQEKENTASQSLIIADDERLYEGLKAQQPLQTGKCLWMQQAQALLNKRLIIFKRRYILLFIAIILPTLLQTLFSYILPSTEVLVDELGGTKINKGSYTFNINDYKSHTLPVRFNSTNSLRSLDQLLAKFYALSRRPYVRLVRVENSTNEFVANKRKSNLGSLLNDYYMAIEWRVVNDTKNEVGDLNIVGYYSTMAYHSPGILLNEISNLLLAWLNSNNLNKRISTRNTPIPPDYSKYTGNNFLKYLGCFDILPLSLFNFIISILVAFIISVNVMHMCKERANGSMSLQLISGTNTLVYWLSNYMFDWLLSLINILAMLLSMYVIGLVRYESGYEVNLIASMPTIGFTFLLMFASSFSWTLLAYCWSHFFKNDVAAFVVLFMLLTFFSLIDVMLSFVQLFMNLSNPLLEFTSASSLFLYSLRIVLSLLMPNLTIKRALFNFRLKSNDYCIESLNHILKC
jgi:hypothetical protein